MIMFLTYHLLPPFLSPSPPLLTAFLIALNGALANIPAAFLNAPDKSPLASPATDSTPFGKAVKKKVLHKNTAARKKSRIGLISNRM